MILCKNIRKVALAQVMSAIAIIFLSAKSFAAPVTLYDVDLTDAQRLSLVEAYDNKNEIIVKESEKSEEDAAVEEEAKKNEPIEDEYLKYEKELLTDIDKNTTNIETNYANIQQNVEMQSSNTIPENDDLSIISINSSYKYKEINKNVPDFNIDDYDGASFEDYADLDELGRCGVAFALLGPETMPKEGEVRGIIGQVKPSGWQTPQKKYDFIDGKFLYNRCHLIGWQLSNENANVKNLITGTRWLNTQGMLPIENMIANYIKTTGNHVLYRVTPIYEGTNLLASRIHIEALSYEDNGASIKLNIILDNYQPGVYIDYATGESYMNLSTESEYY